MTSIPTEQRLNAPIYASAAVLRQYTGPLDSRRYAYVINVGLFYWSPNSIAVDDGTSIIAPTGQTAGRWLISDYAVTAATCPFHVAIMTPATSKSTAGKEPTANDDGAVMTLEFTLNNDAAWRSYKVPATYTTGAAIHIHWMKSGDANEATKTVRWRVTYKCFAGSASGDVAASQTVVDIDDTYDDTGTTTRVMHRTADTALTGIVADYYLAVKVEAVTPAGVAMASEPALFSLDFTGTETIVE